MDVAIGRVVAVGAQPLFRLAVGEFLPPRLETVGGLRIDRLAQLQQYRLAVADDGQVILRAELPISSGSISMRATLASALKRGGKA